MIKTYLTQLEELASASGVDLAEACEHGGVARSTLYRWRRGLGTPREDTAVSVAGSIELISHDRANQGAPIAPLHS